MPTARSTAKPSSAPKRSHPATSSSRRPRRAARTGPDTVGVRELRQNLSVYLDRVKAGEPLLVSEHGRVVAVLRPLKDADDPIERLIALGLATRATRSIRDLPPPRPAPSGAPSISEVLEEMRREERY